VIGRFTKYEYPKTADHQNQETKTKQAKAEEQKNHPLFPKLFPVVSFFGQDDQMDYRASALLDLSRQNPSELSAWDDAVNAASRRRDDVYRALPSGGTFYQRRVSQNKRPLLPPPPPSVPPPPSRARFV
jgi:hypothetical protein